MKEKQRYEKPEMVTEKVDIATFVGQGSGSGVSIIAALIGYFGMCGCPAGGG